MEAKIALYAIGEIIECSVGDVLIEADTPNANLFVLLEGAFKVYLPQRPGRKAGVTLGHRGPGDVLGEYSFVDDFVPTARVTASTPSVVLRIPHSGLRDFLASDDASSATVYRNLLSYLVVRLRSQDEEIDCLMF
jgi:CRP-like cAMP-binding protein